MRQSHEPEPGDGAALGTDLLWPRRAVAAPPALHGNFGVYPLAAFSNTGQVSVHWMDQSNTWWDAHNQDTDYINYTMDDVGTGDLLAKTGTADPYFINSTWGWGQSVWWFNFA